MPPSPGSPELLPPSARLAWWGTAWLRGAVVTDQVLDAVRGLDAAHHVAGLAAGGAYDGGAATADPLVVALGALRARGVDTLGLALPVEGDLLGLGGPRALNDAALEVGEAVVASGPGTEPLGLVPERIGAGVVWQVLPAQRRQLPDVGEADRALRGTLLEAASDLARLDVARWRPEVADALMDLRHRPALDAPPGVPHRCVDLASRGLQALGIAELALEDDGGALTVHEAERRAGALRPLERAGRRALVAACSPEVWPPA